MNLKGSPQAGMKEMNRDVNKKTRNNRMNQNYTDSVTQHLEL